MDNGATVARRPRVYIEGEPKGSMYHQMFESNGFDVVNAIINPTGPNIRVVADLVCFTGGADVDPYLYDEGQHPRTHCNPRRDESCLDIFDVCVELSIPMVGVCRGSQLLCVANGGRLWQDVGGHARFGTHKAVCKLSGEEVDVTSTHHQMMRPSGELGEDYKLLMVASCSTYKESMVDGNPVAAPEGDSEDVEAVLWPNTLSMGFQPHPEFMGAPEGCTKKFFEYVGLVLGPKGDK